jgi:proline dehydrogenase
MSYRPRPITKAVLMSLARIASTIVRVEPFDLAGGVQICLALAAHGIGSTIGKFTSVRDEPAEIVADYCGASDVMRETANGTFYLSLKPPALDFALEPTVAIASRAFANGHGVHFDSHGHDVVEPSLALLDRLLAWRESNGGTFDSGKFSVSIPSRWKRSIADAEWAAERGVIVRLVKGEFRAASGSVELESRRAFVDLAERLTSRVPTLAIGTHDYDLAHDVLTRLRGSAQRVRLELLYGYPVCRMLALARKFEVPVAFYVAYGDTLLAYGIRDLLTHPHKLTRGNYLEAFASPSARLARILRYWAPT